MRSVMKVEDDDEEMTDRTNRPFAQDIRQRSTPRDSETARNTDHERMVEESVEVEVVVT